MKCLGVSGKPRGKGPKTETEEKMKEYNQEISLMEKTQRKIRTRHELCCSEWWGCSR